MVLEGDTKPREKEILKASWIGMVANIVLGAAKALLGLLSGSIALFADALNNFSDVFSSVIVLIGTKIAQVQPDSLHPFGHGRVEYLSSMVIAVVIICTGVLVGYEAFQKLFEPVSANYTVVTVIVMVIAVAVKLALWLYFKSMGKQTNSDALIACGKDSLSDALITGAILFSLFVNFASGVNLEVYITIGIAGIIVFNGLLVAKKTFDELLGENADEALREELSQVICDKTSVQEAKDLLLHNYGPDAYIGSINVKIDNNMLATDIAELEKSVMRVAQHQFGIRLTSVGVYV